MATVFLDANALIDLIERKPGDLALQLTGQNLFISPLSLHILAYVHKYTCPTEILRAATETFSVVDLTGEITARAALGPTRDYEDNIQLQSACLTECEFFITSDKDLLRLSYFGKTKIVGRI